jgi:ABC-type bacteriocin/lantibiotic exporter with double-glycine peptidase domain
MVLSAYGVTISESELAQRTKTNEFGTELGDLVLAADALGFEVEASSISLDNLRQAIFPIVYLDGVTLGRSFAMHAVVVEEVNGNIRVLDPAKGEIEIPIDLFLDAWKTAGSYAVTVKPRTLLTGTEAK